METIRQQTIMKIEAGISSIDGVVSYNIFMKWVTGLKTHEIEQVILGCAEFVLINSNMKLFAVDKEEKKRFRFRSKFGNCYLEYAKSVYLIRTS